MNQIIPLIFVNKNEKFLIKKFLLSQNDAEHLRDLGAVEGRIAQVIDNQKNSVVIKIDDTRYALNKDFAEKILVSIISKEMEL